LAQNVGLAEALNAGLQACTYELVARADSDDLSEPTRFARLIPALVQGGYTVLGSAMLEVNESNTAVESTREAIVDSERLLRAMDSRNPIYHPSVAFVKSAVQQLGGYEFVPGAEDWWLWMRLRDAGYRLGNIPEALVRYRVGAGAYTKRGGVDAWLQDVAIQRRLYTGHGISKLQWAQNMAVRSVYRFVPEQARRSAFRALSSLTARASSRSSGTASEGGM
ncbi:glycosyltransferase, partial [Rothia mucilaginosa]